MEINTETHLFGCGMQYGKNPVQWCGDDCEEKSIKKAARMNCKHKNTRLSNLLNIYCEVCGVQMCDCREGFDEDHTMENHRWDHDW